MEKFKVVPTNIRTGATAPYYVVQLAAGKNANNKRVAEEQARSHSRLSNFDNWSFEVEKI